LGVWISRIEQHRHRGLGIALRRLLAAARERASPTDALIDAVIVWENLFGTREGEVTLRVSASLAWLLGEDAASRGRIFRDAKKLYTLRSKIVHGASEPEGAEAVESRRRAVELSTAALRALFRDHPELLASSMDGAQRSSRLILASAHTEEAPATTDGDV
jgi:hypothetical protein